MGVFSHLDFLEGFFHRTSSSSSAASPSSSSGSSSGTSSRRSARELYEMVQHAGNVLPRLYLMITAGTTLIRSRRISCAIVLRDMCSMCRGVQHPTRGLFLRYYLLQKTTSLLPEKGSAFAAEGGGRVEDAIDFVLENTVEMIRLWVRMRLSGSEQPEVT